MIAVTLNKFLLSNEYTYVSVCRLIAAKNILMCAALLQINVIAELEIFEFYFGHVQASTSTMFITLKYMTHSLKLKNLLIRR